MIIFLNILVIPTTPLKVILGNLACLAFAGQSKTQHGLKPCTRLVIFLVLGWIPDVIVAILLDIGILFLYVIQ